MANQALIPFFDPDPLQQGVDHDDATQTILAMFRPYGRASRISPAQIAQGVGGEVVGDDEPPAFPKPPVWRQALYNALLVRMRAARQDVAPCAVPGPGVSDRERA